MNTLIPLTGLVEENTGFATTTLQESLNSLPGRGGLDLMGQHMLTLCDIFLWILVIIWTIKDSNYRSEKPLFVIFSLLLVTLGTPLIGLPIYLAIRPLGYKYERAYWKAVMTTTYDEEVERTYTVNQISQNHISDDHHLKELQNQLNNARKRKEQMSSQAIKTPTAEKKTETKKEESTPTPRARKPKPRNK